MSADGPLLDLLIYVSDARKKALEASSRPVPHGVRIRALVDTGASLTVIDHDVISKLGLTPTGITSIHTPSTAGTAVQVKTFDARLVLSHHVANFGRLFDPLPVVSANLKSQGIDALIGRDVLRVCLLVYDGQSQTFSIAF